MMRALGWILVAGWTTGCGPKQDLDQMIREYGFTSLRPPSTLLPPGTIVYRKSASPLQAGILCTAASAVGEDVRTVDSPTADLARRLNQTASFTLGAAYLAELNAHVEHVESITLTLKNATLVELPRAEAIRALTESRSPYCEQAITLYRDQGLPISVVVSVLKADVVYDVEISNSAGLGADATTELLGQLALALNVEGGRVAGETIEGTGLIWGAQDELNLATLGLPPMAEASLGALPDGQTEGTPMAERGFGTRDVEGTDVLPVATLTGIDTTPIALPQAAPAPSGDPDEAVDPDEAAVPDEAAEP